MSEIVRAVTHRDAMKSQYIPRSSEFLHGLVDVPPRYETQRQETTVAFPLNLGYSVVIDGDAGSTKFRITDRRVETDCTEAADIRKDDLLVNAALVQPPEARLRVVGTSVYLVETVRGRAGLTLNLATVGPYERITYRTDIHP